MVDLVPNVPDVVRASARSPGTISKEAFSEVRGSSCMTSRRIFVVAWPWKVEGAHASLGQLPPDAAVPRQRLALEIDAEAVGDVVRGKGGRRAPSAA